MKKLIWCLALAAFGFVATGCRKSEAKTPPPVANNAHVDLGKLRDTLSTNTDASVQASLTKVAAGLRYGYDYTTVMEELDKLSTNSSVTPAQKKVVGEVMDQVKQFMSKQAAAQ